VQRVSAVRERNRSWKNDKHQFAQVAAFRLEDGTRLGEKALGAVTEDDLDSVFLALRWRDVHLNRGELTIRGEKAKDGDTRVLPILARLSAVLATAKTDPAGKDYGPAAYVFGELGYRSTTSSARGDVRPQVARARADLAQNGARARVPWAAQGDRLHFHDLRREGRDPPPDFSQRERRSDW
jgi:hypothetical protein